MIRNSIAIALLILQYFYVLAQPIQGNLLNQWSDESLVGSSQYGNIYNEVWGLAVNDSEYAIIGSTQGTHFINVTDPSSPIEDFFVRGASFGNHIIHRDYHDYNGYLYAVSGEDRDNLKSALQIIDISNLPESIDVIYNSNARIRKAHNIFIDTSQAKLYACAVKGGDAAFSALRIYDISNIEPVLEANYTIDIGGSVVANVHDAFVNDHLAYLNAGNDGLLIVDFANLEAPEVLTSLKGTDYPDSGYNHSGWLSEDGKYYYFADETWGTDMKVYDVTDPRNIILVSTFDAGNDSQFSIPHNQVVYCNYIFTSYYYDGLQVHDISDPENPKRVMYYPTTSITARANYEGAWGVYPFLPSGNILVSDMQNGLFIIEKLNDYCTPSSLDEQIVTNLNVKLFPNPNNGRFVISSDREIQHLKLYNMTGSLVYEAQNVKEQTLNMHHLNAGIYFAELNIGNYRLIEKVIIQH